MTHEIDVDKLISKFEKNLDITWCKDGKKASVDLLLASEREQSLVRNSILYTGNRHISAFNYLARAAIADYILEELYEDGGMIHGWGGWPNMDETNSFYKDTLYDFASLLSNTDTSDGYMLDSGISVIEEALIAEYLGLTE